MDDSETRRPPSHLRDANNMLHVTDVDNEGLVMLTLNVPSGPPGSFHVFRFLPGHAEQIAHHLLDAAQRSPLRTGPGGR